MGYAAGDGFVDQLYTVKTGFNHSYNGAWKELKKLPWIFCFSYLKVL